MTNGKGYSPPDDIKVIKAGLFFFEKTQNRQANKQKSLLWFEVTLDTCKTKYFCLQFDLAIRPFFLEII